MLPCTYEADPAVARTVLAAHFNLFVFQFYLIACDKARSHSPFQESLELNWFSILKLLD